MHVLAGRPRFNADIFRYKQIAHCVTCIIQVTQCIHHLTWCGPGLHLVHVSGYRFKLCSQRCWLDLSLPVLFCPLDQQTSRCPQQAPKRLKTEQGWTWQPPERRVEEAHPATLLSIKLRLQNEVKAMWFLSYWYQIKLRDSLLLVVMLNTLILDALSRPLFCCKPTMDCM